MTLKVPIPLSNLSLYMFLLLTIVTYHKFMFDVFSEHISSFHACKFSSNPQLMTIVI